MTPRGTWRDALTLLRPWLVVQQLALAVVVFVCGVLWLRIPDSHGALIVVTVLFGLLVAASACGWESSLLLRLGGHARTRGLVLRGALLVLAFLVFRQLWMAWSDDHLLDVSKLFRWSNYFVSKLPHALRYIVTAARTQAVLVFLFTAVEWVGVSLLAALLLAPAMSRQAGAAIRNVVASLRYWITALLVLWLAGWITARVMDWTPGHTLKAQMLSLVSRLGFVAVVDTVLLCCVLATTAAIVRVGEQVQSSDGTPVENQPRTTDIP